ncbi:hypothetical protein QUB37_05860 [Microcoleus sp. AT3-A2]|uniref:hypothetical protein n=1 Tax=Microcoleus sp. AT3-A2 TaxID=2818610 RepID=UPI002FD52A33
MKRGFDIIPAQPELMGEGINFFAWEWQHIKKDERSGQIFDSELELASGVIHGVKGK